jgi:hypothetical protein
MNPCDILRIQNVQLLVYLNVALYGSETWTLGENEERIVKHGAGEEC